MYLISLYFDDEHTEKIEQYVNIVEEKTKNSYLTQNHIPVHMTLATLHEHDEKELIKNFDLVIRNLKAGTIDLVAIGSFASHTVFVMPVLNKYLFDLSFQINAVADREDDHRKQNRYRPYSWIPHITIARKLNQKEHALAYQVLSEKFQLMTIRANRIALSRSQPYQDICVWHLQEEL